MIFIFFGLYIIGLFFIFYKVASEIKKDELIENTSTISKNKKSDISRGDLYSIHKASEDVQDDVEPLEVRSSKTSSPNYVGYSSGSHGASDDYGCGSSDSSSSDSSSCD